MEIAIGVVLGVVIGLALGGLAAWFAAKARTASDASAIRAEAELAQGRLADSESASAQLREESDDWQRQAIEGKTEISRLEEQVAALERDKETSGEVNAQLTAEVQDWREKTSESENAAATLRAQLDAVNKNLDERTAANAELTADIRTWRQKATEGENASAALRAQLDAANKNLDERTAANAEMTADIRTWREKAVEGENGVAALRAQLDAANKQLSERTAANAQLTDDARTWRKKATEGENAASSLRAQLDAANKQLAERTDIEKTLLDQFKVMATEVVSNSNESFLNAADEKVGNIVKPLSDELKRIETARNESQGSLKQQIDALAINNVSLERETRNLTQALKAPQARGRWGEVQLRRVAELAGMIDYCDFREQVSIPGEDGTDRPDMVVYMPSERTIVVDAKTPLNAYIESLEADSDEGRDEALAKHAAQVRERATSLTRTAYWNALDRSPEFVVMFLPGEFFLQPALERDPDLFDRAMRSGVVIATPNTLMALLKTVEMGWKEARIAEEARTIANLGGELHDRLAVYAGHIVKMGSSLRSAVGNYNNAVGSFDSRVSVSARRFKELGTPASGTIPEMKTIDAQVRQSGAEFPNAPPLALNPADADGG